MTRLTDVVTSISPEVSYNQIRKFIDVLPRIFSRRWILTTILVFAAVAVMVRLGIWQLDRLEQRRIFNARVHGQTSQPALDLNQWSGESDLNKMEYRRITVVGKYDHSQEIALRNQHWKNQSGVHLITPLQIAGSENRILVDRGWIPSDGFKSGDWSAYNENGRIRVEGIIRASISKADFGTKSDPNFGSVDNPVKEWNFVTVDRIQQQIPQPLIPIYIQQSPDNKWTNLPHRSQPKIDLTEGPHMGYAIQWFTFAAILAIGYPIFIRGQEHSEPEQLRE